MFNEFKNKMEMEDNSLLEVIPDMFLSLKYPSGRVLYVNYAVKEILGYEPSELYHKSFFLKIVPRDFRRELIDKWRNIKEGNEFPLVVYPIKKKDDSVIWVEQKNKLIKDSNGTVVMLNAIIRDITERKKMDNEAMQNQYFSENLFKHAPYIIIHFSNDGSIKRVNRHFKRFIKIMNITKIRYNLWEDELLKEKGIVDILKGVLNGKIQEIPPFKYDVISGDSMKNIFLSGKAFPYLDETGNPSGIIVMIEDVTKKIKLEEEYLEIKKIDSIGRLARGIAHDFNNILTGIIGYSGVLMDKLGKDDENFSFIEKINDAAVKASTMTNQLLGFSKSGKYNPEYVNILNPLMYALGAAPDINPNIEIVREFEGSEFKVFADVNQLRRAFLEILKNSIEAIPDAGRIFIKTEYLTLANYVLERIGLKGAIFVKISILDTGVGFNRDIYTKVFEPYFTTKNTKKHSGMGLSIAYGIIKNHGGKIEIRSNENSGTEVILHIPAVLPPENEMTLTCNLHKKILIIENDEEIKLILKAFFEERGYSTTGTSSGKAGLELFKENPSIYDIVFISIFISDISGKEVMRKIRMIDQDIKIILISDYHSNIFINRYIEDSNINILLKPFNLEELVSVLK